MTPETHTLPPLPASWSELSWQQITDVWRCKMRYGGNPDVAIVAAMLALYGLQVEGRPTVSDRTGEGIYRLRGSDGRVWTATARELSHYAHRLLPWFPFPYGDQGEPEQRDEQGRVIRERREGHRGYVNPAVGDWRDAMALPVETVTVDGIIFALPQVACSNLTWHQYRSLQAVSTQLFREGVGEGEALDLQAQFLAYSMVPGREGQQAGRFQPEWEFKYVAERAEQTIPFWRRQLEQGSPLFCIVFQVWQTAVVNYYPAVFPLLFGGSGTPSDPLHTALTGEVGTINAVMKYQGYSSPQEIYDTNLPIILGVLSNMTKEAKEIEKMNSKIKRK